VGNATTAGGTLIISGTSTIGNGNLTVNNGSLLMTSELGRQTVLTLSMGGGPVGAAALIEIGAGNTLAPTAITFVATNNNETAVIGGAGTLDLGSAGILMTVGNSTLADIDMAWEMNTLIGSGT